MNSLADVGALAFHMEPLDLADTVCSAVQGFTPRLMEKSIALQLDMPAAPSQETMVKGDAQRLRQVMQNLLENTLRYTDAGGTLRVHVHQDGDWQQIDVQDSAPVCLRRCCRASSIACSALMPHAAGRRAGLAWA